MADQYLDFAPWLLSAATPSIRYLTLRRLLGRAEDDAEVQAARQEMAATGPIPAILARQTERGNWAGEHSYYSPKYTSTHWSMTMLAELSADGQDERLRRGVEFMLADTEADVRKQGHGWVCFWGNLLRYALHGGFEDDPRVARLTDRVVRDATEAGWRCQYNGELPCAWGAARALWGLAAMPVERRSPEVTAAIESGLAFFLEGGHLVAADYPTPGKIHSILGAPQLSRSSTRPTSSSCCASWMSWACYPIRERSLRWSGWPPGVKPMAHGAGPAHSAPHLCAC